MLDESKCVSVGGRVVQTVGAGGLRHCRILCSGDVFFGVEPAHLYYYIYPHKKKNANAYLLLRSFFRRLSLLFPCGLSSSSPSSLKTFSLSLFKLDKIPVNSSNKKVKVPYHYTSELMKS